jgi:hypothetical protein
MDGCRDPVGFTICVLVSIVSLGSLDTRGDWWSALAAMSLGCFYGCCREIGDEP